MSGVIRRSTVTAAIKTSGRKREIKMEVEIRGVEKMMMRIIIPVKELMKMRRLGELEEVEVEEEIGEEEVVEGDEGEEEAVEVEEVWAIVEGGPLEGAETEVEVEEVEVEEVEVDLEVEEEVEEEGVEEEEVEEEEVEEAVEAEDDFAIRFLAFCLFLWSVISYFALHFMVFYLTFR